MAAPAATLEQLVYRRACWSPRSAWRLRHEVFRLNLCVNDALCTKTVASQFCTRGHLKRFGFIRSRYWIRLELSDTGLTQLAVPLEIFGPLPGGCSSRAADSIDEKKVGDGEDDILDGLPA